MKPDQLQRLILELQDGSNRQRRAAAFKLGRSGAPTAVPALINAYNDADGLVRQNALDGLRLIASVEALDFLAVRQKEKKALESKKPVRTTVQAVSIVRRYLNYYIDLGIFSALIAWPLIYPLSQRIAERFSINAILVLAILELIFLFGYYFLFETLFQRTPAKWITGTKVTMQDGSKPDVKTISRRSLIRLMPPFLEGLSVYHGENPNEEGTWWHDRWTDTRVVRA